MIFKRMKKINALFNKLAFLIHKILKTTTLIRQIEKIRKSINYMVSF